MSSHRRSYGANSVTRSHRERAFHPDACGDNGAVERIDRKLAQLCQQAREALTYAFATSTDEVLRELSVASVMPAPDSTRLMVTVYISSPVTIEVVAGASELDQELLLDRQIERDRDMVLGCLQRARGYLRSEVAASINRKRAPELAFTLASSARA